MTQVNGDAWKKTDAYFIAQQLDKKDGNGDGQISGTIWGKFVESLDVKVKTELPEEPMTLREAYDKIMNLFANILGKDFGNRSKEAELTKTMNEKIQKLEESKEEIKTENQTNKTLQNTKTPQEMFDEANNMLAGFAGGDTTAKLVPKEISDNVVKFSLGDGTVLEISKGNDGIDKVCLIKQPDIKVIYQKNDVTLSENSEQKASVTKEQGFDFGKIKEFAQTILQKAGINW